MAAYSASIEIAAPPGEVFPFLIEPDRLRHWIGGFVELRPLTSGAVGVGTRSIDVFTEGGREIRMETEILTFEPGHLLEVAIAMPGMKAVSAYRLTGTARTAVAHTQTVTFRGFVRLMAPFIGGSLRRRMAADLARLKSAVEGR